MNQFDRTIGEHLDSDVLTCSDIQTIQVNIGLQCNLACIHCYLESDDTRSEQMPWPVMEQVIAAADHATVTEVDITGGAPERHPDLKRFIASLVKAGRTITVRTNLAVLTELANESFPAFYRDHGVHLIASLPCYLAENVDAQRGPGVYHRTIATLRELNALGYGTDPSFRLDLVYNPGGAFLPGDQASLESDYKRELGERFGITFNRLLTITNMPIGRFRRTLESQGTLDDYQTLLEQSFNPATIEGLMCRHQVNVGCDGRLYDCDFNHALGLAVNHGAPATIGQFDPDVHAHRTILTGTHCFGCTAGAGSSCGGALT